MADCSWIASAVLLLVVADSTGVTKHKVTGLLASNVDNSTNEWKPSTWSSLPLNSSSFAQHTDYSSPTSNPSANLSTVVNNATSLRTTSDTLMSGEDIDIGDNEIISYCSHDVNLLCKGEFCTSLDSYSNITAQPTCALPQIENGVFKIPPIGSEVSSCVGEGQTVFLICDSGYEIISGSAMTVMELMCYRGNINLWDEELCVTVHCDFPYDWVRFTEWETELLEESEFIELPYKTLVKIECWLPDLEQNWSYLLECQADGSWSGSEAFSKDNCLVPHKEKEVMANARALASKTKSASSHHRVGKETKTVIITAVVAAVVGWI